MLINISRKCSLMSIFTSLFHTAFFAWRRKLQECLKQYSRRQVVQMDLDQRNIPELSLDMCDISWWKKCCTV